MTYDFDDTFIREENLLFKSGESMNKECIENTQTEKKKSRKIQEQKFYHRSLPQLKY